MDLHEILTQSQSEYFPETDAMTVNESLSNTDFDESVATRAPEQPASERTGSVHRAHHSLTQRPQSFPYQPIRQIDDRLHELALQHEIHHDLAQRLRLLEEYEITIVCDDSGSMKTQVGQNKHTRWDELGEFVKIVLEIGTIFDSSGVDIYFLNRPAILNVTDPQQLNEVFSIPPRGYTPLVRALKYIFRLPATRVGHDKKSLIFIATDGAPTDEQGIINVKDLEHLMLRERNADTTHVMFLLCTDDPACIEYLTEWDRKMVNVDVTADFRTERRTIRRFRGANYPFSHGDYIVKALLGAIDREMDDLNDPLPVPSVNGD